MAPRKTTEDFIQEARGVWGDRYDYSKLVYTGVMKKLTITCRKHGDFQMSPNNHLRNKGCRQCRDEELSLRFRYSQEEFIQKARELFGDLYIYDKVVYVNNQTKVCITCRKHGDFMQQPKGHLKKRGCKKCAVEASALLYSMGRDTFIERAGLKHNYKYTYTDVVYVNNRTYVKIGCIKHGIFEQIPDKHLQGNGCPGCDESKGELEISAILDSLGLKYDREKRYADCRRIKPLPFDFYIPSLDVLVEFDGEQHERAVKFFGGEEGLAIRRENDGIKTQYAKNNDIPLLRIRYDQNVKTVLMIFLEPFIQE